MVICFHEPPGRLIHHHSVLLTSSKYFKRAMLKAKALLAVNTPFPHISEEQTIETSLQTELKPQLYA